MVLSIVGDTNTVTVLKGLLIFSSHLKVTKYLCFDGSNQCSKCLGYRQHPLHCKAPPACDICAGRIPPNSTQATALSVSSRESHVSTPLYFASTAQQLPTTGTLPSVPLTPTSKPPLPTRGNPMMMKRMYLLIEFSYLLLTVCCSPFLYLLLLFHLSLTGCVRRASTGRTVHIQYRIGVSSVRGPWMVSGQ